MKEMMTSCERARTIIDSWQRIEMVSEADFSTLSNHVIECDACARRYRMLLPLIRRDLEGMAASQNLAEQSDESFTQRVMKSIAGGTRPFPARSGALSLRRVIPAAAAAVVLVLAIGLLIRGFSAGDQAGEVTVHFVLDAPGAQRVSLVGSFNGWNTDALPLRRASGTQQWEISLKLKRGETYLYNFVVNGNTWIPDPTTDLQVEDGFGGKSSLMQL